MLLASSHNIAGPSHQIFLDSTFQTLVGRTLLSDQSSWVLNNLSVLQIAQVMLRSLCSLSCRVLTWNFLPFQDRGKSLFFTPQGKGCCSSGSHLAVGSWAAHRYVGWHKAFGTPLLNRVAPAQQDQNCMKRRGKGKGDNTGA